ncbi:MAG: hypothetical protein KDI03_14115, partial [Anaerolineae bacterium]|nr:hypothetical protein [Anaerolineae bacterium]
MESTTGAPRRWFFRFGTPMLVRQFLSKEKDTMTIMIQDPQTVIAPETNGKTQTYELNPFAIAQRQLDEAVEILELD